MVSTHSRPKAAGAAGRGFGGQRGGFNTQPPEGGWPLSGKLRPAETGFNTQPPEGGWPLTACGRIGDKNVSTHSRPKAAGGKLGQF